MLEYFLFGGRMGLVNLFRRVFPERYKSTLKEDEAISSDNSCDISLEYSSADEIKHYLKNENPGYPFDETVNQVVAQLFDDRYDIIMIHKDSHYIVIYMTDQRIFRLWSSNGVWGLCSRGQFYKNGHILLEWDNRQPCIGLMAYIQRMIDRPSEITISKEISPTLIYDEKVDTLFRTLFQDNIEDAYTVTLEIEYFRKQMVIELKNGTRILMNIDRSYESLGEAGVVDQNGKKVFSWNDCIPSYEMLYQLTLLKKRMIR